MPVLRDHAKTAHKSFSTEAENMRKRFGIISALHYYAFSVWTFLQGVELFFSMTGKNTLRAQLPGYRPDMTLHEVRKAHIDATLKLCGGNKTHAAKLLQVHVRSLRNWTQKAFRANGWNYMLRDDTSGLYKLGWSKCAERRSKAKELRHARLIVCWPGNSTDERTLHGRFEARLQKGREWFALTPEDVAEIMQEASKANAEHTAPLPKLPYWCTPPKARKLYR